jgi:hypothetical protein
MPRSIDGGCTANASDKGRRRACSNNDPSPRTVQLTAAAKANCEQ